MITFSTTVSVPNKVVSNLLVGGFENRYSDWLGAASPLEKLEGTGHRWYSDPESLEMPGWGFLARFDGKDDPEGSFASAKRVTMAEITDALRLMHDTQPRHFNDLMSDNDDADTADVFLQLLLLGDVIYG